MKKLLIGLLLLIGITASGQRYVMDSDGSGKKVIMYNGVRVYNPVSGGGGTTFTLGDDDLGESATQDLFANLIAYFGTYTASASGTVLSAHKYIGATGTTSVYVAIYNDNGGEPGTLVTNGVSDALSVSTNTYNEFSFTTAPEIVEGNDYWLAILSTSGTFRGWTDAGSATLRVENGSSFPATASSNSNPNTADTNFYLTVQQ